VVVLTVDRPRAKNALDHATLEALVRALDEAAADRTLAVAILTGAGDTFVSGGDLRELRDRESREDAAVFSDLGESVTSRLAALPFPVLCALPGAAIGGGAELAVACDLRIADPLATLAFRQVRMGVTTSWGTAERLVALVGPSRAARLLYTATAVDAAEAAAMGLVDAVAAEGSALDLARAWGREIALGAPAAVAGMKRLVRAATDRSAAGGGVRELERELFVETWSAPDHHEAVEAYFARRAPAWRLRG